MKYLAVLFIPAILFLSLSCGSISEKKCNNRGFIRVSRENPSYFSYSDGTTYIPAGINMINPSGRYRNDPDSSLYEIGQWMKKLSDNGGNYIRVWLSQAFWDVEDQSAGSYNAEKARRIDSFISMARENNLRIKMTLEHFRSLTMEENPQQWAVKSVYHRSNGGPLDSIRQFLSSPEGHRLFLGVTDFYKKRYGSDTLFFGWELWNEMNAVKGPADEVFLDWNRNMLKEVKERFPENLVMQSLGSFDNEKVRPLYKEMMLMPGNEVAQVHRYLDLGARMEVCHMPMDVICSSAVEELRSYNTGKPVILAETGAVEPSHSGPSRYYAVDTAGILLHDILFAPFFSGAAGAGMCWHWDSYVDRNNLWYHYRRFTNAISNIDPVAESFIPLKSSTGRLRIYILKGKNTSLLWLRDTSNTWITELRDGIPPETLQDIRLDPVAAGTGPFSEAKVYDPWKDKWETASIEGNIIALPSFSRSIVVRLK